MNKIYYDSWGYDQTNIDFYLVVRETAKTMTLEAIGSDTAEDNFMAGHTIPNVGKRTGKLYRAKKTADGLVSSLCYSTRHYLSEWNGKPVSCSWYA